jgi:hypothetical protein
LERALMGAFDFLATPRPTSGDAIWDRLVRLVQSMSATEWIRGVDLVAGAEGNPIPHGQPTAPKFFSVSLVGAGAATAIVTKDPVIGANFLRIYTTADCKVDIELRL